MAKAKKKYSAEAIREMMKANPELPVEVQKIVKEAENCHRIITDRLKEKIRKELKTGTLKEDEFQEVANRINPQDSKIISDKINDFLSKDYNPGEDIEPGAAEPSIFTADGTRDFKMSRIDFEEELGKIRQNINKFGKITNLLKTAQEEAKKCGPDETHIWRKEFLDKLDELGKLREATAEECNKSNPSEESVTVRKEYVAPKCEVVDDVIKFIKLNDGVDERSVDEGQKFVPGWFDGIVDEMKALHAKKNSDYGNAAHESFREFGIISYVIRLNDKMNRLKSLTKPGVEQKVTDEKIEDTLMDLAAYAIMAIESLRTTF